MTRGAADPHHSVSDDASGPELTGRVVLVTGAARHRGIGRAVALRLADLGGTVVVAGRVDAAPHDHERAIGWTGLDSLVDEIEARGGRATAVTGDVADRADAARLVDAALEHHGRIDVLVNNAGSGRFGPLLVDLDPDEWDRVLRVNLTGTFLVSRIAARAMIAAGEGGSIVNVSSVAGRAGVARMGAYSPAKFGVIGLTQTMAAELAEHAIRVNCVAPGGIATDLEDATFAGIASELGADEHRARAARVRRIPLGRLGAPDEAAAVIAFLASRAAGFVTGQTITVAGGPPFS
jgi:NAD(P)-dependent dehydrogenase (short-subunit alcohol dehydrogenase family)